MMEVNRNPIDHFAFSGQRDERGRPLIPPWYSNDIYGWIEPVSLRDDVKTELQQHIKTDSDIDFLIKWSIVEVFAVVGSIASVTQVGLIIADMWSRHVKEKAAQQAMLKPKRPWDEVKAIRVQMSNGIWVEFESWLDDPEKVKNFVKTFNEQQFPKPINVEFVLNGGRKALIEISEQDEDKKRLDAFIAYLML